MTDEEIEEEGWTPSAEGLELPDDWACPYCGETRAEKFHWHDHDDLVLCGTCHEKFSEHET